MSDGYSTWPSHAPRSSSNGKSLHDALAEVHRRAIEGDIADPSEAPALVETHLHVPYAYEKLRDKLRASAEASVTRYLEQNALDDVEFSEKTVEINFGNGVRVNGRIDLVRRRDTDETTIVDLKSTQRAQAENVTEAQLHVYALGYRELCGRNADFVEIYNLDEGRKDNKPRSVDEDLIEHVRAEVQRTAQALRTNDFEPQPRQRTCRACDYMPLCTKGQIALKRT